MTINTEYFLGLLNTKITHISTDADSTDYRVVGRATTAVDFITTIDNRFAKEKKVLGRTVKKLLIETGTISNKSIIISLIKQLELSQDNEKRNVLRSALEIIVGITPDDIL